MADDEKFILEGLIEAGDGGRDGKLTVDELDAGDGSFETDGGDFERWVASGVDNWGGLEANEKINRKHNHEEGGCEDFDEALGPAKRVEIVIVRHEK